jgi:hypothetical protein
MEIEHVQQREKEEKLGKMGISMLWSQKVIVTSTIFFAFGSFFGSGMENTF